MTGLQKGLDQPCLVLPSPCISGSFGWWRPLGAPGEAVPGEGPIEFDVVFAREHPGCRFGFDYKRAWHRVAVACSPELPARDSDANYTGKYLQISQAQQR